MKPFVRTLEKASQGSERRHPHCAGGPLTESLKHCTVLPTIRLVKRFWKGEDFFPKAVVRGEAGTVTRQAARQVLYRGKAGQKPHFNLLDRGHPTVSHVCHIPTDRKHCQLLTKVTDSVQPKDQGVFYPQTLPCKGLSSCMNIDFNGRQLMNLSNRQKA